uniref:Uncharacterized protein n=1 Tax=Octactis speculum TaxID=3111310 RepID=A0A7S2DNT4_9STRA
MTLASAFPASLSSVSLRSARNFRHTMLAEPIHAVPPFTVEDGCRRRFITSVASLAVSLSSNRAQAAVIEAARCDSGVGPGCELENNELIKQLLTKSAENREKYARENISRYNINNYKDYFKALSPPKFLVEHVQTGKYEVLDEAEVRRQMNEGTVKGAYQRNSEYIFVE